MICPIHPRVVLGKLNPSEVIVTGQLVPHRTTSPTYECPEHLFTVIRDDERIRKPPFKWEYVFCYFKHK